MTAFSPRSESSDLIGREQELRELEEWFAKPSGPLVIWGQGGLGKTALAREFGKSKATLFVDVTTATSFDHVLVAIGEAAKLGYDEAATLLGLQQALLTRKIELLVIDNIEQLGEEIATLPRLTSLASHVMFTSRLLTGFPLETQLALQPLPIAPNWSSAAILLLLREAAIDPSTMAEGENLALYSKIAAVTDGIPLALGLAAIQISKVGAALTASQLEDSLLDLPNEASDRPTRQRTMDESIDWSWRFLGADDQRAVLSLSLFASTFTFEDALEAL